MSSALPAAPGAAWQGAGALPGWRVPQRVCGGGLPHEVQTLEQGAGGPRAAQGGACGALFALAAQGGERGAMFPHPGSEPIEEPSACPG